MHICIYLYGAFLCGFLHTTTTTNNNNNNNNDDDDDDDDNTNNKSSLYALFKKNCLDRIAFCELDGDCLGTKFLRSISWTEVWDLTESE